MSIIYCVMIVLGQEATNSFVKNEILQVSQKEFLHIKKSNNLFQNSAKESNHNDLLFIFVYFEVNGFLEFSSLERDYKILVDDSANHNFTYWSSECEGE